MTFTDGQITELIARLRSQEERAKEVMERIADQGSIEAGNDWAIDEHQDAYDLAEVAKTAAAALAQVKAERGLAESREHTAPTDGDREALIQVLSEQGAEYGGRLDEVADVGEIADAILTSPVIRRIQAEAWDEGMAYGVNYDAGDYEVAPEPIENPYRGETA